MLSEADPAFLAQMGGGEGDDSWYRLKAPDIRNPRGIAEQTTDTSTSGDANIEVK